MKDLLYLKDEQIKEFIQLLYYAYRETFSDPKEILSKKFFGPAHLRALNLIEGNPGINLGELIFRLKVTKQSLNRVLRDLIKAKMIKQIQDENDTRKKNLFCSSDIEKSIHESEMIFMAVNTPTKETGEGAGMASDLKYVIESSKMIAKYSQSDKIIIEKSTLPVRTAEKIKEILSGNSKK